MWPFTGWAAHQAWVVSCFFLGELAYELFIVKSHFLTAKSPPDIVGHINWAGWLVAMDGF